jgi:threonine synthase
MDIQVASNFERYLYYRVGSNSEKLQSLMTQFKDTGALSLPLPEGETVDDLFIAGTGSRAETLDTIRKYHQQYGYILDPHTAVGVHVAEQHLQDEIPTICLATAHPAKFSQAIQEALGTEAHHEILDGLANAPTRCKVLPADEQAVREFLVDHARG